MFYERLKYSVKCLSMERYQYVVNVLSIRIIRCQAIATHFVVIHTFALFYPLLSFLIRTVSSIRFTQQVG
uniref:Uncharacterized protein n=1 Tax=Parascaris univalens TaxID=6257 RepID=A0A915BY23_PARUN